MSFGSWLKAIRKQKGFTQEGLAKAANNVCTGAYISSLERQQDIGKRGQPTTPSKEIVDALAEALGVPKDQARLAAGYAPDVQPRNVPMLHRRANRFSEMEDDYASLAATDQAEMEVTLRLVAEELKRRRERQGR